jgi:hypothetical protein
VQHLLDRPNLFEHEHCVPEPVEQADASAEKRRTTEISISSISPAVRYCWATFAPPPSDTSLPSAASWACPRAGFDPVDDEVEGGASLHLDGVAGVVGEDVDRVVEGWLVTPPAVPRVLPPGAGTAPNMLRPITVAPMFGNHSSTIGVLALPIA